MRGAVLAWQGHPTASRATAAAAIEAAAEVGGVFAAMGYVALIAATLAAGDTATAQDTTKAWPQLSARPQTAAIQRVYSADAALAGGDLLTARRWADEAVRMTTGYYNSRALTTRARVALAQGEPEQAERDAHDALAHAAQFEAYLFIPDILECLAALTVDAGGHREAARLLGSAHALRERMGAVRFKIYESGYEASVAALRDAVGEKDFDIAWAEGTALSTEEAIAYAQRGRGQRKRPSSGWGALTPLSLTWYDWSATGWPTTTSPQGCSSRRVPCRPTSPTSTPNWAWVPASNSSRKRHATTDSRGFVHLRQQRLRGLDAWQ